MRLLTDIIMHDKFNVTYHIYCYHVHTIHVDSVVVKYTYNAVVIYQSFNIARNGEQACGQIRKYLIDDMLLLMFNCFMIYLL